MNNIALANLESSKLYINKNILTLEVLNSVYNKTESTTILEYIKNFWIIAKENKKKYHFIINIHNLGVYPLSLFTKIIKYLSEIEDIFKYHLHSSCVILNSETFLSILKPLFNIYKPSRPFTFVKNKTDAFYYLKNNTLD